MTATRLPVAELEAFFRDIIEQAVASRAAETATPAEWLSVRGVAALLDMSPEQARRWIERTPEVQKQGARVAISETEYRYSRTAILAFLSSKRAPDSIVAMAARRSA